MGPAGEVFFAKLSLKKADLGFLIKLLYHKEVCNSLLPFFEERQGFLPSFSSLKSEVVVAGCPLAMHGGRRCAFLRA